MNYDWQFSNQQVLKVLRVTKVLKVYVHFNNFIPKPGFSETRILNIKQCTHNSENRIHVVN
jgi:hypothetical protein